MQLIVLMCVFFKILDAKDLQINKITETELDKSLNYSIGEAIGEFGSKLTIELPQKQSGR